MLEQVSAGAKHHDLLTLSAEERQDGGWMISYLDIMTLLVALFVLIVSAGGTAQPVQPTVASKPPVQISAAAVSAARRLASSPIPLPEALQAAQRVAARPAPMLSETAVAAARTLVSPPVLVASAIEAARTVAVARIIERRAIAAAVAVIPATRITPQAQAAALQLAGAWRVRQAEKKLPLIEGVEVSRVEEGINLRIQDHLLFGSGDATLTGAGEDMVQTLVTILERYEGTISVEGHTDSVPISTARFPSNWELSSARATAILRYLAGAGIDATRLRAVGYADTRPLKGNDSEAGRAANRRVEVIVHSPQA